VDKEVARLQSQIDELNQKEISMKEDRASLVEKFQKEYEENLKLTKTTEDHQRDLKQRVDTLFQKTDIELQEEKAKLVKKHNGDAYIVDKVEKIDAPKTMDDFRNRVEQLNKFAMGRGILRRFGATGAEAGGKFTTDSLTTV